MTAPERAREVIDWVIDIRRDIHAHPELSMQEQRTTQLVVDKLTEMGIENHRIGETGVLGILHGSQPGKVIALRADMDALPLNEQADVPFKSQNPGVMHACGHDAHTAMLLGAAKILNGMRDQLKGTVKFIFQPGEEVAKGAKHMIEGGVLENPHVDMIMGIHLTMEQPAGKVIAKEGPCQAGADLWDLEINGKTCHGSTPWYGEDAIVCAAAVINGLQTIVSRKNDARSPLVLNIGTIKGGERFNNTPGHVEMQGNNRSFSRESREKLPQWMENVIKGCCDAYHCTYKFNYDQLCSPTINDPDVTKFVISSITKFIDPANVVDTEIIMGSEDFSEYQALVPGMFLRIGVRNEEKNCIYPGHSDHYCIDEDGLLTGVACHVQVVSDFLA